MRALLEVIALVCLKEEKNQNREKYRQSLEVEC